MNPQPTRRDADIQSMSRLFVSLVLAAVLVFSGGSATLAFGLADDPADARSLEAGGATSCAAGEGSQAKAILACLSPSIAFVETTLGSGSGILLEGGYVVTNVHVVEPFAAVDLVFEGGESHRDVPVKGVDLVADIALVGPIRTKRPALTIGGRTPLEKGDDVYLVGYPGEVDERPDVTISRGILSRTRRATDHGLSFLQTDAAIGGGQSGGALVDSVGHVLGVSGLSFAEEFALALSGADVKSSVDRILGGDVPDYRFFPEDGSLAGTFALADDNALQVLTVAPAPESRTVRFGLPARAEPAVSVVDVFGEVLFQNQAALDKAVETFGPFDRDIDADQPVAPGRFEFEIPPDRSAVIVVGTRRAGGAEMSFTSDVALGRYDDEDEGREIQPGQSLRGEIDTLEVAGDGYLLDLAEGQSVLIHAGSAVGDIGFAVQAPGQAVADATYVDDSGVGLFDIDAKEVFTAESAGVHRLTVYSADGMATAYRLRVTEA